MGENAIEHPGFMELRPGDFIQYCSVREREVIIRELAGCRKNRSTRGPATVKYMLCITVYMEVLCRATGKEIYVKKKEFFSASQPELFQGWCLSNCQQCNSV